MNLKELLKDQVFYMNENMDIVTEIKLDVLNTLINGVADRQQIIDKALEFNVIVSNSDYVYSQDEVANKNISILNGDK